MTNIESNDKIFDKKLTEKIQKYFPVLKGLNDKEIKHIVKEFQRQKDFYKSIKESFLFRYMTKFGINKYTYKTIILLSLFSVSSLILFFVYKFLVFNNLYTIFVHLFTFITATVLFILSTYIYKKMLFNFHFKKRVKNILGLYYLQTYIKKEKVEAKIYDRILDIELLSNQSHQEIEDELEKSLESNNEESINTNTQKIVFTNEVNTTLDQEYISLYKKYYFLEYLLQKEYDRFNFVYNDLEKCS